MWVYETELRDILEVNDAAVAAYGYSREEFLSLNLFDLRPPEDVERLRNYLRGSSASQLFAGEWRHQHKDGEVVDVEVYLHDIEFNGRAARLALLIDVTDRRAAGAREPADLRDVGGPPARDRRLSAASSRSARAASGLLGYRPEEMIGRGAPASSLVAEDLEATRVMRCALTRPPRRVIRQFRLPLRPQERACGSRWRGRRSGRSLDGPQFFIGRDMTRGRHQARAADCARRRRWRRSAT